MIRRREFLQASLAASAIVGASGFGTWSRLAAQQALTQDQLLQFDDCGNVTLIHVTDVHAQLRPIWFREPEWNIGVGEAQGRPPHVVGKAFLDMFGIEPGSAQAYALTHQDFVALGKAYGRMGGMDRVATVVKAIRAARPEALLLEGGDTWHGSMTSLLTKGHDMVNVLNALGVDAMTSHWEWTFGSERVNEIVEGMPFPFLGANIFDIEWDEPAYDAYPTHPGHDPQHGIHGRHAPRPAERGPDQTRGQVDLRRGRRRLVERPVDAAGKGHGPRCGWWCQGSRATCGSSGCAASRSTNRRWKAARRPRSTPTSCRTGARGSEPG